VSTPPTSALASVHGESANPPRVLLVDDDAELRANIAGYLATHGYAVEQARDAAQLEGILTATAIDLIVLDVMLPGEDGLSICRRLSSDGATPIIMLSAMGDETDRVVGLEIGADDYLPKPCSPRELVARIKAVLRRRALEPKGHATTTGPTVTFEGFELDLVRRRLRAPDGAIIVLSTNEFTILSIFLRHAGRVLSREELTSMGATEPSADLDRAIDMLVSRLRRKLRAHTAMDLIVTSRGRGYRLVAEVDDDAHRLLAVLGNSGSAA
jgi:two-component system OmpR family response regulator